MADATPSTLAGGETGLPRDVGRTAEAARRSDFTREGNRERVDLPGDLRELVAKRLQERADVARDLAKDDTRFGTYDRLLAGDRGEELVDKFVGDEALTAEDMALAWAIVNDELIQKEGAIGSAYTKSEWLTRLNARLRSVQRVTGSGSNGIQRSLDRLATRVHGVLTSDRLTRLRGASKVAVTPTAVPELTSAYIEEIGFTDWSADRVVDDVTTLHRLRVSLEGTLGIPDVNEDVWQQPDFQRKAGHRLRDTAAKREVAILAREHGGMTFAELRLVDPVAAERVRHQAVQEGLVHFSDGLAKDLLKAEKPEVDIEGIDASIRQIGTLLTGIAREQAEINLERAVARWKSAMARVGQIEASRDGLLQNITTAQEAHQTAIDKRAQLEPLMAAEIIRLNGEIATQGGCLATATEKTRLGITAEIARLTAERNARTNERDALITRGVQTAAALTRANAAYDLLDAPPGLGGPPRGSLAHATAEIASARTARETIADQLNGTPDAEQRRVKSALQEWKKVADPVNYEKIIDTRFTQGHQGRFQRERLADTTIRNGEMVGAELLREHVFGIVDTTEGYRTAEQKERGRRMLSDEAIARSIIEAFRVDIDQGTPSHRDLLMFVDYDKSAVGSAELALRNAVAAGAATATLTTLEANVTAARGALRTSEQALLGGLLPRLRDATNFDVGDVLRFAIHEGLTSAAVGEPYLEVPGYYEAQQPERRLRAEAIIGEDAGGVTIIEGTQIRPPAVLWQGPLADVQTGPGSLLEGLNVASPDTDLNFRIRTNFNAGPGGTQCIIEVQTDEALLQSLPDLRSPNIPPAIAEQFYDNTGRLRTRERRLLTSVPTWLRVPVPGTLAVNPGIPNIFAPLDVDLSPEVSEKINVSTANDVMSRSPEERRRIVRGFRNANIGPISLPNPAGGPNINTTATVTMDNNGEFWIDIPTLGRQQLSGAGGYFDDQRELYEQSDPLVQTVIQDSLRTLQEGIGREIMRTQIRR